MVYIIDTVTIGSNTPKFLTEIITEISKTLHHAFEDEVHLERFLKGMRTLVDDLNRPKVRLEAVVVRNNYSEGKGERGSLIIRRAGKDEPGIIRMHWFTLLGHVHASQDGKKVYQEPYIKEGGEHEV